MALSSSSSCVALFEEEERNEAVDELKLAKIMWYNEATDEEKGMKG